MTVCGKYCEHKAAYWKLHTGWILEQAESGSGNSKDSPELKNRKEPKQRQKNNKKREAEKCVFSP